MEPVVAQTPRHDFLHELHKLLRPATYLEIGVQTGRSLAQALPDTACVGIDPDPQISVPIPARRWRVAPMTSDEFFKLSGQPGERLSPIDLAFIDGMHLVEYCLRDFIGVERHARPDRRTVAVFDDVLPYSAAIAAREQPPGDWAGDCWKIDEILRCDRLDLTTILVDVDPTGALVVLGLDPANTLLIDRYDRTVRTYVKPWTVPEEYIDRRYAVKPAVALDLIRNHLNITEA
jgi:hypothetical protein